MKKFILLLIIFAFETFAQSWQVIGNMPKPVYGAGIVAKDSLIYIVGGFYYKYNSPTNLIQSYNPRTQEWHDVSTLVKPRYGLIAGNENGKMFIVAGIIVPPEESSSSLEVWNYTSSPHVYDENKNFERLFPTAQIVGSNLFIFGGIPLEEHSLSYIVDYNIQQKKIIYSGGSIFDNTFPTKQTSVKMGNYIYIFGGIRRVLLKDIYRFNTTTFKFKKYSDELPKPRADAQAVKIDSNKVYILGGFNETNSALSSVDILSFKQDGMDISNGPPLNYGRKEFMAVKYGSSIYVFGGKNADDQPVNKIERLDLITGVNDVKYQVVKGFKLGENYPNPFNPSTRISFTIGKETPVSLDVYSILGKHIKNIISGEFVPGNYQFTWDGSDQSGNIVAAGVYIYRLSTKYFTDSKKMILLK